jgi:L-threonylcarbamoyladenylate synthase
VKAKEIARAAKILKEGGLVVFPTETAFGVGCRIDKPESVRRLIYWRKRRKGQPFLVLASCLSMARKYWQDLSPEIEALVEKFWPGPLTLVWFCREELVPLEVRAGGKTLAIRVPACKPAQKLVEAVGVPVLAPSANFSGQPPPFLVNEVDRRFLAGVDFFLRVPCGRWKEVSTVFDATCSPGRILREGVIKKDDLSYRLV